VIRLAVLAAGLSLYSPFAEANTKSVLDARDMSLKRWSPGAETTGVGFGASRRPKLPPC
jgi:hypothetical protein